MRKRSGSIGFGKILNDEMGNKHHENVVGASLIKIITKFLNR